MSLVKSDMCKGSYVRPKMGTVEQPRKFANQDYEMLREWHVKKKVLFTDETFPANMNSIGSRLKKEFNTHHIEWKRPREICEDPHFIVDGVSLFDILQSKLGDCWLLSAIASLTLKPGLLEKIMPVNQGYSRYYAGIFHFRLWHLGEWLDIVIDDKLPFLDGKYFSVRPSCNNEFWPCLLEKAYAKFLGSYQNLHWGDPSEAFINLTGGLTMTFDLQSPEAHTYWNMINLAGPETLMACISGKQDPTRTNQSTRTRTHAGNQRSGDLNNGHLEELDNGNESEDLQNGQDLFISNRRRGTMDNVYPEELEHDYAPEHMYTFNITENGQDIYSGNRRTSVLSDKLPENVLNKCGIVERHAYSITDHAEIPFRNGTVQLIRIWNPWGFGEWRGRWNDRCPQWKELREEDRLRLQRISDDGEFWMCWQDFITHFSRIIICSQVPDFYDWGDQHKTWYRKMFQNRWTIDSISWTSIDKDFLLKNPVYNIKVTGSDQVQSGVNVVLSLMQNSRNRQKFGDWLPIGFVLIKLPDSEDQPLSSDVIAKNISNITSYQKHSVSESFNLPAGRYVAIPYTTQKERESSFLFQVFLKSEDCTDDMGSQHNQKGSNIPEQDNLFRLYATKGSKINAWDLKRLLNDVVRKDYPFPHGAKFTIDGSREILASVDISKKAKLDPTTFLKLWNIISKLKELFSQIDTNRCGYINLTEFHDTIQKAGLSVHSNLVRYFYAKYADAEGRLSFVDYLICTVRLEGAMQTFSMLSADGKGACDSLEMLMQLIV